jgi:hypothetical protein
MRAFSADLRSVIDNLVSHLNGSGSAVSATAGLFTPITARRAAAFRVRRPNPALLRHFRLRDGDLSRFFLAPPAGRFVSAASLQAPSSRVGDLAGMIARSVLDRGPTRQRPAGLLPLAGLLSGTPRLAQTEHGAAFCLLPFSTSTGPAQ